MAKILILSKSHPYFGGVESWMDTLIDGLRQQGHQVAVALVKGREFHDPQRYIEYHQPCEGAFVIDGVYSLPSYRIEQVLQLIAQEKPDIVMPIMCFDALVAACRYKERFKRTKILLPLHAHTHCAIHDVVVCADWVDHVICVDELSKRALAELVPDVPVSVLPHGVAAPEAMSPSVDCPSGTIRVGYCGRLETPAKRARDLAGFFCRLSALKKDGTSIELLVAGSGSEETFLREKMVSTADIRVTFIGTVSADKMYQDFYSKIDVLLVFSSSETGPLVIWEAMRHGVVPITSRYLGLRSARFLQHGHNSLVFEVGDVEAAVQCLMRISGDDDLRCRIASQAKNDADRFRSVEEMMLHCDKILECVLNAPVRYGDQEVVVPECSAYRASNVGRWLPGSWDAHIRRLLRRPPKYSCAGEEWFLHSRESKEFGLSLKAMLQELDVEAINRCQIHHDIQECGQEIE